MGAAAVLMVAGLAAAVPAAGADGEIERVSTLREIKGSDAERVRCPSQTRHKACRLFDYSETYLEKGRPVGQFSSVVRVETVLSIKSLRFSQTVSLSTKSVSGKAVGAKVNIRATCGKPCSSTSTFKNKTLTKSRTQKGTISYSVRVAKNRRHQAQIVYTFTVKPKSLPTYSQTGRSVVYRCDDELSRQQRSGCAFSSVIPSMPMKRHKNIAKGIRVVQGQGLHLGRQGGANAYPLTWTKNAKIQADNYKAMCGGKKPPKKGYTCDEYPFKTTLEGGYRLGPANGGIRWVPSNENNRQGGDIIKYTLANRILDGDKFWVKV